MAFLALVYVALGVAEDRGLAVYQSTVNAVLNVITSIFVAEFSVRIFAAESRWAYLRRHWIDLLAVLPSVRFLRLLGLARMAILLRVLRIVRLGVIASSLIDASRAATRVQWIARRNGVHVAILLAIGIGWIGASLAWEFEHATNAQFKTFGDALWWAFSTMATLGYGTGPATLQGRIVAGVLMSLGIACFGLVTATVTTDFLHREHADYTANDLMAAINDVRLRMSRLEEEVIRHGTSPIPRERTLPAGSDNQRYRDAGIGKPPADRTTG
jgi:voltage-gated potassium channel